MEAVLPWDAKVEAKVEAQVEAKDESCLPADPDAVGYVCTVPVMNSQFGSLRGIVMLPDDSVLVADATMHCIWRVDPQGRLSVFAGVKGRKGYSDGIADQALFNSPQGLCTDGSCVFVADYFNSKIRCICRGVVSTIVGKWSEHSKESEARFSHPFGMASVPGGNIVIAEKLRVSLIGNEGHVTNVAGKITSSVLSSLQNSSSSTSYECSCRDANFSHLRQIAVGKDGSIYVTDYNAKALLKIANGKVQTILGDLSSPYGVAIDTDENIFVSEFRRNQIITFTPTGEKKVLCGSGRKASKDGNGLLASLHCPRYLYCDSMSGFLFFTEENAIRKVRFAEKRPSHLDHKLSRDLMKLVDNSDIPSTDAVEFLVEGRIIQVAKTSLCIRSEYFQKMLQSGWKESQSEDSEKAIPIEEATYDAFYAVIAFLVAGVFKADTSFAIMTEILVLADQYLVDDLKEMCMRELATNLSVETVIECLLLSEKHGFEMVLEASLRYAAENVKEIRVCEGFDSLTRDILSKIILNLDICGCGSAINK